MNEQTPPTGDDEAQASGTPDDAPAGTDDSNDGNGSSSAGSAAGSQDTANLPDIEELCEALNLEAAAKVIGDCLANFGFGVLPIPGGRKHTLPSLQGARGAMTDIAQIEAAFETISRGDGEPGVGVVPGTAGLVVLTSGSPAAAEAWELLTGRHPAASAAITTTTPSGGSHFWYRLDDEWFKTASTHTPELGVKAHDGYIVAVGGEERKIGQRKYRHSVTHHAWEPLTGPAMLMRDARHYDGADCDLRTAEQRIDSVSHGTRWTDDIENAAKADISRLLAGDPEYDEYRSVGPSDAYVDAMALIEWAGDKSDDSKLRPTLESAFEAWQRKHAHRDRPVSWGDEALRIAWDYLITVHFCGFVWGPQQAARIDVGGLSARGIEWRRPRDRDGELRKVPVARISANPAGVAAALAPEWEISETVVAQALARLMSGGPADPAGQTSAGGKAFAEIHTSDVFTAVFDKASSWKAGASRLAVSRFVERVSAIADFRLAADGTLWRYCQSGDRKGMWLDDGDHYLSRLLLRCLGDDYTLTQLSTARQAVVHNAQAIQDPNDMSTWQPDHIIFCRSGVIEWRDGGRLREPLPQDNLTVRHPWVWDPSAACPEFDRFAATTFAGDALDAVWEVCGAALYPRAPWKRAILLHGPRNSGKSTFLKVLTALVGEEWVSAMSLIQISENRFMPANLFGKRLNVCGDISSEAMPDPAVFKQLVGGDEAIQADVKNKQAFTFRNQAKLLFSANELPRTRDFTDAFFLRWLILACRNSVADNQIDYGLEQRLTSETEMAGVARKAVDALARLIDQHDYTVPKSSTTELQEYRLVADVVLGWADERLEVTGDDDHFVSNTALRGDLKDWCERNGYGAPSATKLTQRIKPFLAQHNRDGHDDMVQWNVQRRFGKSGQQVRGAIGIQLRPDEPAVDLSDADF